MAEYATFSGIAVLLTAKNRPAGGEAPSFAARIGLPPGRIFILQEGPLWVDADSSLKRTAGLLPGFSGCLALERSNVGEVPIALLPGMRICQIFLHHVSESLRAKSQFFGRRKPMLGNVNADDVLHGN
jgi:hypothetical protein